MLPIVEMNVKRGVSLAGKVPDRALLNAYGAYQWWLSKEWLNEKDGTHPAQNLWRTGGWASDSEIFIIGYAIHQLHKNGTKKSAFEEKKREFLGQQKGNQTGYLFEFLVAQLFLSGGNKVVLLPAGKEGYDLDVITPKGVHIQVSCKVAEPSEHFKRFVDLNKKFCQRFAEACQSQQVQGGACLMEYNQHPPENEMLTREIFEQAILATHLNHTVVVKNNSLQASIGRLPVPSYAKGFSPHYLSYNFIAMQPIDQKAELTRVVDRVKKANKLFKKHASPGKHNLTVIRIPPYLSIESAKERIEQKFKGGDFTSTSSVLLLQSHIVVTGNDERRSASVRHGVVEVKNPGATVLWEFEGKVDIVHPLGSSIENFSPPIELGGHPINGNHYMYMDNCQSTVVSRDVSLSSSTMPGIRRLVCWEGNDWVTELPFIPNEFTLL